MLFTPFPSLWHIQVMYHTPISHWECNIYLDYGIKSRLLYYYWLSNAPYNVPRSTSLAILYIYAGYFLQGNADQERHKLYMYYQYVDKDESCWPMRAITAAEAVQYSITAAMSSSDSSIISMALSDCQLSLCQLWKKMRAGDKWLCCSEANHVSLAWSESFTLHVTSTFGIP